MAVSRRTHSVSRAVQSSICNSTAAAAAVATTTAAEARRVAQETVALVCLAR